MFFVLLLVALATVVGAMLTALPWLEGRFVDELTPRSADAPTGNP